jgi:hypothetical protein
MASISGKPPLVCPSGEQIVNGGFETGDFTGWTASNRWFASSSEWGDLVSPPAGSYMACCHSIEGDPPGASETITGTLEQIFATPIPVACFGLTSVFSIKTNWTALGCPPRIPPTWQVEVEYTDGTSTVVDLSGDPVQTWTTHDLKAVLASGKTVKGIKFTAVIYGWDIGVSYQDMEVYVDECTLTI